MICQDSKVTSWETGSCDHSNKLVGVFLHSKSGEAHVFSRSNLIPQPTSLGFFFLLFKEKKILGNAEMMGMYTNVTT